MSGGFFDYQDHRLDYMAELLRFEIAKCRKNPEWMGHQSDYSDAFIAEMSKTYNQLRELRIRLHRLDWVLSGDDGEDTYFQELPVELGEFEVDDPDKDDEWLAQRNNDP